MESTNSKDPKMVAARLFIGNLPTDKLTDSDVRDHFVKYGKVLGVSLFKGFGFVQFEDPGDAKAAAGSEHHSQIKGNQIDVRLASERKPDRAGGGSNRGGFQNGGTRGAGGRGGGRADFSGASSLKRPFDDAESQRSRQFDGRGPPPPVGPVDGYFDQRSVGLLPTRDAFDTRDRPHVASNYGQDFGGAGRGHPASYGGGPPPRTPLYDAAPPPGRIDGFRGGPPLQPQDGSSLIPQMDPYGPPPAKREMTLNPPPNDRPFDCVIIVSQKELKAYAESVERRLLDLSLTVDMIFLMHDGALQTAIDDMSKKGVLYVVVVQPQHELHRSITVNISHGTPQEHRNMPLEDALLMIGRNFNHYLATLRGGNNKEVTIGFLLNLVADGKHLSVTELERLIVHLCDRRDRLIEGEGGRPPARPIITTLPGNSGQQQAVQQQQQNTSELQSKILAVLGANVGGGSGSPMGGPAGGMFGGAVQGIGELPKALEALVKHPDLLANLSRMAPGLQQQQQQPQSMPPLALASSIPIHNLPPLPPSSSLGGGMSMAGSQLSRPGHPQVTQLGMQPNSSGPPPTAPYHLPPGMAGLQAPPPMSHGGLQGYMPPPPQLGIQGGPFSLPPMQGGSLGGPYLPQFGGH